MQCTLIGAIILSINIQVGLNMHHMMTSGMPRRLFEGRDLVLLSHHLPLFLFQSFIPFTILPLLHTSSLLHLSTLLHPFNPFTSSSHLHPSSLLLPVPLFAFHLPIHSSSPHPFLISPSTPHLPIHSSSPHPLLISPSTPHLPIHSSSPHPLLISRTLNTISLVFI